MHHQMSFVCHWHLSGYNILRPGGVSAHARSSIKSELHQQNALMTQSGLAVRCWAGKQGKGLGSIETESGKVHIKVG